MQLAQYSDAMCTDQVSSTATVHFQVTAWKAVCYSFPSHRGGNARRPIDGATAGPPTRQGSSSEVIRDQLTAAHVTNPKGIQETHRQFLHVTHLHCESMDAYYTHELQFLCKFRLQVSLRIIHKCVLCMRFYGASLILLFWSTLV